MSEVADREEMSANDLWGPNRTVFNWIKWFGGLLTLSKARGDWELCFKRVFRMLGEEWIWNLYQGPTVLSRHNRQTSLLSKKKRKPKTEAKSIAFTYVSVLAILFLQSTNPYVPPSCFLWISSILQWKGFEKIMM